MSETFAPRLFSRGGAVFPARRNKAADGPGRQRLQNNSQIIRITRPDEHTSLFARSWLNSLGWGELRSYPSRQKKGFGDPSGVSPPRGPSEAAGAAAAGRIGPPRGGCGDGGR